MAISSTLEESDDMTTLHLQRVKQLGRFAQGDERPPKWVSRVYLHGSPIPITHVFGVSGARTPIPFSVAIATSDESGNVLAVLNEDDEGIPDAAGEIRCEFRTEVREPGPRIKGRKWRSETSTPFVRRAPTYVSD